METFSEAEFQRKISKGLERVKMILETTRNPKYAGDVPHQYEDKYGLAEVLTNAALGAQLNCLEFLGLSKESVSVLQKWAKKRSVTLRFKAEQRCVFENKQKRKISSGVSNELNITSPSNSSNSSNSSNGNWLVREKVYTKVVEYYW